MRRTPKVVAPACDDCTFLNALFPEEGTREHTDSGELHLTTSHCRSKASYSTILFPRSDWQRVSVSVAMKILGGSSQPAGLEL